MSELEFAALRHKILQLGLQGDLVLQSKREPVRAPIGVQPAPEEVPFALPASWQWVQLQAVGQLVSGDTPSPKISKYWVNPTITWITATDLHNNQGVYIFEGARQINESALPDFDFKLVPSGSVIYTISGTFGDVAIAAKECCTNNSCAAFVPDATLIDSRWCYYVLIAATTFIKSQAVGSVKYAVTIDQLKALWIPLPPLLEQKRICDRWYQLMQNVSRLEENYFKFTGPQTQHLRDLVRQYALSGKLVPQQEDEPAISLTCIIPDDDVPFELPEKWCWVCLRDIVDLAKTGYSHRFDQGHNQARLLDLNMMSGDQIAWSKGKCCLVKDRRLAQLQLECNDIVMVKSGAAYGKTKLITGLDELPCVFNMDCMRLRVSQKQLLDVGYLELYLNSSFYWEQLSALVHGTGITHINGEQIELLPLPLPPLAEQRRIVAKVTQLFAHVDQQTAALKFATMKVAP